MRFSAAALLVAAAAACVPVLAAIGLISACTTNAADDNSFAVDTDAAHRDASTVDPAEGGLADAGVTPDAVGCTTYCDTVMANCTGDQAQYTSNDECLAFCGRFPAGVAGASEGDSIACREFYAGSPALTDSTYCTAAGPYGGAVPAVTAARSSAS